MSLRERWATSVTFERFPAEVRSRLEAPVLGESDDCVPAPTSYSSAVGWKNGA